MSGVDTFVDEANGFLKRNPQLDDQQKIFGGLLWGAMRAVAECPNCPGHYRVPITIDGQIDHSGAWDRLACSQCSHVWVLAPIEAEKTPKTKRQSSPRRATIALQARLDADSTPESQQPRQGPPSAVEGR